MKETLPRVFVDTNVWFSAFWHSTNCEKIIKAHIDGQIKIVISQTVLTEIVRNLSKKIPQTIPAFEKFFVNSKVELTKDTKKIDPQLAKLVDKKDQKIFASTITSNCQYFITGNIKDFDVISLKKTFKIKVITPSQAVKLFKL